MHNKLNVNLLILKIINSELEADEAKAKKQKEEEDEFELVSWLLLKQHIPEFYANQNMTIIIYYFNSINNLTPN